MADLKQAPVSRRLSAKGTAHGGEGLGRVLIIAGSDSGGGAGIQADIKAVTALAGYAATAVTALTAQDTKRVAAIHAPPPDFLRLQMAMVLDDIGADAIKLGMLHDAATVELVADFLSEQARDIPTVADPVLISAGGDRLLAHNAEQLLIKRILPLATVLTPNLPEAETLLGRPIVHEEAALREAASALRQLGSYAVLLKGGHLRKSDGSPTHQVLDVLALPERTECYRTSRIEVRGEPHGTGCTLASAVACGLARGLSVVEAVEAARAYLLGALRTAQGFGSGNTPLKHSWRVAPEYP